MKHWYFTLSLLAALVLSASCSADRPDNEKRYVQVSASSYIEVLPDFLTVSLSLQSTQPTLVKARSVIDKAMKSLLKTTEALDIKNDDIEAAQITNYPQYEWNKEGREYRGEEVNRSVTINLRDKDNYATLVHQLMTIKEIRLQGSEMKFNDRAALENQALALAVKAARAKAEVIAKAADNRISHVLSVQEGGHYNHYESEPRMMKSMSMSNAESAPAPMLIGKQRISATVSARFALDD